MVKGRGGNPVSRKIKRSFTKNKIGVSRFKEKKVERFSLYKSKILLHFEKLRPKQSLPDCCHFPSTSRSARCKKETEFRVLHITNCTIFLHCKIIRVIVGGVVIVFGELIVSWVPRCRCTLSSIFPLPRPLGSTEYCTPQKSNTAFVKILLISMGCEKAENGISPCESVFFVTFD